MEIVPGEMVCLLGGNASGKTTTLKTILGYVTPSSGEVLLEGEVVSGPEDHRDRAAGRLDGSGEPLPVRQHDGGREPGARWLPADRPVTRGGARAGPRDVPSAPRAAQAEGRDPLGRRAADGRDGPRTDGQPEGPADGRAVDGPGAGARRAGVRDHPEDPRARARRSGSSSRTRTWRCRSPTAATRSRPGQVVLADTAENLLTNPLMREAYLGEL